MTRSRGLATAIGLLLTAAASAQVPPAVVRLESRVNASGAGEAIVSNLKTSPLTAYLLDVIVEPCSPVQPQSSLRASDAALALEDQPLRQSQSRTEVLGVSHCNKIGASTPARAELKAAIFQDGSTSGDPASVSRLLDNRRLALRQCEAILGRLKEPGVAAVPADALTEDLRARVDAALETPAAPSSPPLTDIAAIATASLNGPHASRTEQIARTVAAMERLRQHLLDAKPPVR